MVRGLGPRALAVDVVEAVLQARTALDETFERLAGPAALDGRDRALARAIVVTAFRRYGTLGHALDARLERGWHSLHARTQALLVAAGAEVLFLDTPVHAAIDGGVELAKSRPESARTAGLVNAVLRRLAMEAESIRANSDPFDHDTPRWLRTRWRAAYGEEMARRIAASFRHEPAIDLSVKADPHGWAARLDAELLPTGSLRLRGREAIDALPGYAEGAWWVQDAASAMAGRLLGDVSGQRVLDMCAAPGGKTAQLCAAGAEVVAMDRSAPRMKRLRQNLARLNVAPEIRVMDATALVPETMGSFDAVLLDAPCSATGTIRRHPDVGWTKTEADLAKLVALQARLLERAAAVVRPGGHILYCTCSLEPAEGEEQIARTLAQNPQLTLDPIRVEEVPVAGAITAAGQFRALPFQIEGATARLAGWAGFFAARLVRT